MYWDVFELIGRFGNENDKSGEPFTIYAKTSQTPGLTSHRRRLAPKERRPGVSSFALICELFDSRVCAPETLCLPFRSLAFAHERSASFRNAQQKPF